LLSINHKSRAADDRWVMNLPFLIYLFMLLLGKIIQ